MCLYLNKLVHKQISAVHVKMATFKAFFTVVVFGHKPMPFLPKGMKNLSVVSYFFSQQYKENKSFCEDLTEGKFSFPIIHGIRNDSKSTRIMSILSVVNNGGGGGTGGRETGRKGGGRCTGGGRRGGGKRDSQGGGKREGKGKITQHYAMFRNRKNAKGREPKNTGREPGLKSTGSRRFKPPCPPPPHNG